MFPVGVGVSRWGRKVTRWGRKFPVGDGSFPLGGEVSRWVVGGGIALLQYYFNMIEKQSQAKRKHEIVSLGLGFEMGT